MGYAGLGFTLDYPFEKPFVGSITGELTLHEIGDLVIEQIDLCDGDRLEISIGS